MLKIILALGLGFAFSTQAQVMGYIGGAESRALGNLGSVGSKTWAIFNNPAALSDENRTLTLDITRLYGLDLKDFAAAYAAYRKSYQWGLGVNYFGDRYLNQARVFVAWAKKIRNVSLGLRTGLLQFALIDQPTIWKPQIDIGGSLNLNPKLIMGLYIVNATATKLPSIRQTEIQSLISLGLNYKFNTTMNFYTELEKSIQLPINFKTGLKYEIQKYLTVLLGLNTLPLHLHYGILSHYRDYTIAYSLTMHRVLGLIHRISFAVKI